MAKKYIIELTEKQARLLSRACDTFSRLIEGQGFELQNILEFAWEKRCKKATGKYMDEEWDGGWHQMSHDAEITAREAKRRFWGQDWGTNYGVHYDDYSDIIWDLHQCLRHALWEANPNPDKPRFTVDADPPYKYGSEPLATIKVKEEE